MAYNSERGVDYFVANTGGDWVRPGKNPGDEIGQYRNLLIWLRPVSDVPFFFQLPKTAQAEIEEGIWFFQLEKTWLAIRPINLSQYTPVTIPKEKFAEQYREEQTFKAAIEGDGYAGFALEVGELETHSSYDSFKRDVKRKSKLDLSELAIGKVGLRGANGNQLQSIYNPHNLQPLLMRNGVKHDWIRNFALYNSLDTKKKPISLSWKQGQLKVEVGGLTFETEGS